MSKNGASFTAYTPQETAQKLWLRAKRGSRNDEATNRRVRDGRQSCLFQPLAAGQLALDRDEPLVELLGALAE